MLYFCIAPFEDLLTGSFGTVAKYLALIIAFFGLTRIKNWSLSLSKSHVCIIWLMVLSVISCLWAIDFNVAVGRISAYLTVPGICLFVSMLEFSKKEYDAIANSAIVGGVLASLYIISENGTNYLSSGRITLNENNDPNNLAALLLLPLGLAIGKVFTVSNTLPRLSYMFSVVVMIFVFFLTGSRGGLLGLISFFVAYLLFAKKYKKSSALFGVIMLLVVVMIVVIPILPEEIVNRLFNDSIAGVDGTGSGRTKIWKIVLTKIIPYNFIMGVGPGCMPEALMEFYGYVKGVHNTYLNMLGEYGILGLPAFLVMLYDKWHNQYKLKQYIEAALLVGICVIIFFLDSYAKKFFWNIIMLIIINEKVIKSKLEEEK